MNFGELLTKLMKEGVGAPGSQRTWTVEALAARMDVCDKSVKNWRGNVHSCTNPGRLASVLFGSYECQDRKQLLRENEILSAKGNTYAAYASKSTVHGFWDRIFERVEFSESDKSLIEAGKISDAAWTITQANPRLTRDVALSIAHEARCFVFNMKYGIEATIEKDERHVHGIEMWNKEFAEILNDNNIERTKSDLLVVGIGAGFEGVKIYNEFRSVVGVDISEVAVEKAQQAFSECKNVEVIQGIAEELPEYAVNKDIYICLKTYQSSYFDIELSVIECARSLRSGGVAIISIPRGYTINSERVFGISKTIYNYQSSKIIGTYTVPDKEYVYRLITKISMELNKRLFTDIRIHTGKLEYYVIATKTK